jgi:putative tryptophan/tyrosine transport system substrate-binding protein
MRRREFIALVGGTAVGWPLSVRAQQPDRMRRIAILMSTAESDAEGKLRVDAFLKALRALGWTEGRNVHIVYRWAAGDTDRTSKFAQELVSLQPDAILSQNTPSVPPLLQATRTIPIVFIQVSEPVKAGFVASMAQPGGNIPGFTSFEPTMSGKWLEMLKAIAPRVVCAAFVFNPATSPIHGEVFLRAATDAAPQFGVEVVATPFREAAEIERAIGEFARHPNGGLVVLPDATTNAHQKTILTLAAQNRLPAVYAFRFYVAGGGLMSYGPDPIDQFQRAAGYVDRILKGANPGDLPIQQPLKFELAINLQAARALGLSVPQSTLLSATEVIE